ncbi:MAG: PD40 domain-containing protein [Deltaproteobacteria bacterium]|nr:PD40 domain-containing protein [Deltaproteobacteria bacterium]
MSTTRQLLLFTLLTTAPLAGCTRLGFDTPREADLALVDTRADVLLRDAAHDTAPHDTSPHDITAHDTAPADLGPSKPLPCIAPSHVDGTGAWADLREVTLRSDGLTLTARKGSGPGVTYATQRSAWGQPFGLWKSVAFPTTTQEDPTFFPWKNAEAAIVAKFQTLGGPRSLFFCTLTPSWTCQGIVVRRASTGLPIPITDDMDGASVAVLPDGSVLMAHNVAGATSVGADIYLAHPTIPGDLTNWTTSPILTLTDPNLKEDDPALSPDGLVIIFAATGPGTDGDLWISRRVSLTDPFPTPILLATANSASDESSASLAPIPGQPGHYELFFISDRNGNDQVYRTTCGP